MNAETLSYFWVEAQELVSQLEAGLLSYEQHPEVLPELFRFAHTLKGGARVVRRETIADLAHAMEDVLAHHREAATRLGKQEIMELLHIVDAVRAELNPAQANSAANSGEGAARALVAAGDLQTVRIEASEMDGLAEGVHEASALSAALRVEIEGLVQLRKSGSSAELAEKMAEQERRFTTLTASLELELRRLGQQLGRLRLIEASRAFPELERAAHDAAVLTGKQIAFAARGGGVKLDGHVLSPLRGALLHLVRNAVAHGVETPELRRECGKPDGGCVELLVERRGARIAFVLRDDGAGIDLAAVRRAAAGRGLPVAGDAGFDLIFQPGVSTSSAVSDLSGRGVGLDAVRMTVRKLKGSIEVHSEPGRGTRFEIVVPVSLSSMQALVVGIGARRLLVPLDTVAATVLLVPGNCAARGDGRILLHEDRALPLHDLHPWLEPDGKRKQPRMALVLATSRGQVALAAHALFGTREIIVRPLPGAAGESALVLGTAFDSQGDPELVLDPEGLGQSGRAERIDAAPRLKPRRILVVDDSLTTRMLEQSILEGAGYEVDLASSAQEGLQKAMQDQYGLIVTDVEMPGMNGYEFTAETRRRPELRAIPVIMVSSLGSEESRKRGADAGVSAYIVKGEFDQGTFLGVVREWLG
jgi:two-component system chemotaxis sensor kinase CheA